MFDCQSYFGILPQLVSLIYLFFKIILNIFALFSKPNDEKRKKSKYP